MTDPKPTIAELNCETNVTTFREMTDEEFSAHQIMVAKNLVEAEERQAEAEALAALKASARAKLVAGTPLTEEEAATIVL